MNNTRFFLTLFIFLIGGYSQPHAYASEADIHHATMNICEKSDLSSFVTEYISLDLVKKSSLSWPEKERLNIEITENEIEEEELIAYKKYLEISNCFTTLFDVETHGYFIHYLKRLHFYKHFSCISSYTALHLIFQVFRI